jgi:CBS domain-containing protein
MKKQRPERVKEAMSKQVVTIRPDTSVREVARLLTKFHIRSLPVVDEQNMLLGLVTESDLFLKEKGMPFSAVKIPYLFERWADPTQLLDIYEGAEHHTAADVMTEEVITLSPDDTLEHAAWIMFHNDLRVLPVTDGKKLVGILTRVDFIRMLAEVEK